jgi:hypothetical protein
MYLTSEEFIFSSCQERSAESDRRVLQALYAVTGGEQWRSKRGWMSVAPLSEWEGVIINSSGRVTGLHLYENNLCGIISLMLLLHYMSLI